MRSENIGGGNANSADSDPGAVWPESAVLASSGTLWQYLEFHGNW